MADVSKVNVNSTDYNIKDSNAMHRGVDRVTAGQLSGSTLGTRATAEGYDITASGLNSHGEGSGTTAEGENSHAEGNWTFATGFASHTEGEATHATQSYSHAEGYYSTASGNSSHAEGYYNTASGNYSHAEGFYSTASGNSSHAEGYQTKASSAYQHVEGKYNVADSNNTYAHIIGGGTSNNARKNIFTVDWNGDVNAGRSNGLTNDTKLPTGADVVSYLNSNLYPKIYETSIAYGGTLTFTKRSGHMMRVTGCRKNLGFCLMCPAADNENPIIIYNSGILSSASVQGLTLSITVGDSGYGSFVGLLVETF